MGASNSLFLVAFVEVGLAPGLHAELLVELDLFLDLHEAGRDLLEHVSLDLGPRHLDLS